MQTLCINKNVVQMMLSQIQTEDTHFPAVIYNSELFGWAKDLLTQVRITNSQFLGFCFYEDRSWRVKHIKCLYNAHKTMFLVLFFSWPTKKELQ